MFFAYLSELCNFFDIRYVNYPHWAWGNNRNMKLYTEPRSNELYSRSIVYLGNRQAINLSNETSNLGFTSIAMVRDPRDALVSMYYSFLGSHRAPRGMSSRQREDLAKVQAHMRANTPIDQYVLEKAPKYLNSLNAITSFTDQDKASKVIRYEDYILNKPNLCDLILSFLQHNINLELTISPSQLLSIATKYNIIPNQEDSSKHIRKALPGDHLVKLNSHTIYELNVIFKNFLAAYDYV
jgi:hypothetical protein